jgi:hypothetical protein
MPGSSGIMHCSFVCSAVRYWTLALLITQPFVALCKGFSDLGNLAA